MALDIPPPSVDRFRLHPVPRHASIFCFALLTCSPALPLPARRLFSVRRHCRSDATAAPRAGDEPARVALLSHTIAMPGDQSSARALEVRIETKIASDPAFSIPCPKARSPSAAGCGPVAPPHRSSLRETRATSVQRPSPPDSLVRVSGAIPQPICALWAARFSARRSAAPSPYSSGASPNS